LGGAPGDAFSDEMIRAVVKMGQYSDAPPSGTWRTY